MIFYTCTFLKICHTSLHSPLTAARLQASFQKFTHYRIDRCILLLSLATNLFGICIQSCPKIKKYFFNHIRSDENNNTSQDLAQEKKRRNNVIPRLSQLLFCN